MINTLILWRKKTIVDTFSSNTLILKSFRNYSNPRTTVFAVIDRRQKLFQITIKIESRKRKRFEREEKDGCYGRSGKEKLKNVRGKDMFERMSQDRMLYQVVYLFLLQNLRIALVGSFSFPLFRSL